MIDYIPYTISLILSYEYMTMILRHAKNIKLSDLQNSMYFIISIIFSIICSVIMLIGPEIYKSSNTIDQITKIADLSDIAQIIALMSHSIHILNEYYIKINENFRFYNYIKILLFSMKFIMYLNIILYIILSFTHSLPEVVPEIMESVGLYLLWLIIIYILFIKNLIDFVFSHPGYVVTDIKAFYSIIIYDTKLLIFLTLFGFHEFILFPVIEEWEKEGELSQLIFMRFSAILYIIALSEKFDENTKISNDNQINKKNKRIIQDPNALGSINDTKSNYTDNSDIESKKNKAHEDKIEKFLINPNTLQYIMDLENKKFRSEPIRFWYIMKQFNSLRDGISLTYQENLLKEIILQYINVDSPNEINISEIDRLNIIEKSKYDSLKKEYIDDLTATLSRSADLMYKLFSKNINRDYKKNEWAEIEKIYNK